MIEHRLDVAPERVLVEALENNRIEIQAVGQFCFYSKIIGGDQRLYSSCSMEGTSQQDMFGNIAVILLTDESVKGAQNLRLHRYNDAPKNLWR